MVWWICLEGKPKEETRFPLMRQANVASGMGLRKRWRYSGQTPAFCLPIASFFERLMSA
jgi:hypothetical protein